jgi:hypothetical protein
MEEPGIGEVVSTLLGGDMAESFSEGGGELESERGCCVGGDCDEFVRDSTEGFNRRREDPEDDCDVANGFVALAFAVDDDTLGGDPSLGIIL